MPFTSHDPDPPREPRWRPSKHTSQGLLLYLGFTVLLIGAIALALSFVSVDQAARPYFGAASWAIPVLMDTTIGVLTFFSLVAELNALRSPLARYSARALVALTVYANIAPQHALYGKILHGAPPVVWVLVVAVGENLLRRMADLDDERRIEALRKSLWLLRPLGTWRIWRRMRIEQIATYRDALDKDAARAAVVGRLRLHHGRMWRGKAPLAERIALRLEGRDPGGVAAILRAHADTAALLAADGAAPEAVDPALRPLDPVIYPQAERVVLAPFTEQAIPFAPPLKALPSVEPAALESAPRSEADAAETAARMREQGMSYGRIAERLGRSKTWAYTAVNGRAVVDGDAA